MLALYGTEATIMLLPAALLAAAAAAPPPLTMRHISECTECGRPPQGSAGSWCPVHGFNHACVPFAFDAGHVKGPPLDAKGCALLPCGAKPHCLLPGRFDLYAVVNASAAPPSPPCPKPPPPPPRPKPPLAPPAPPPTWHLPARCEEGDVNALFQWRGTWHLMQQWHARPATSVGHAVSGDLLRFARVPDVLSSGATGDQQCYDGSSSITAKGPMLMIDGGCGFHTPMKGESSCMESRGVDTGGVTAFPADLTDPNLTAWTKHGPTKWKDCEGAAGPSPNWLNPVTGKHELVAINGSRGDALFEATDDTLTSWARKTSDFTPMRGGGGQLWHPLPMAVDAVGASNTSSRFTHIIQIDPRGSGQPNFVLLHYDFATSVASDFTKPTALDTGSVAFGQLSNPGGTGAAL